MKNENLRVIVDYDDYGDISWFKQWNTPEKYYGVRPKCPVCGPCYSMDYVEDHSWKCEAEDRDHEDPITLEYDGADNKNAGVMLVDGELIPFDDYMQTYGDPNNYVFLFASIQKSCDGCGSWDTIYSLGGIDVYKGSRNHWETGTFTAEDVANMPDGYLKNTLLEMLAEETELM